MIRKLVEVRRAALLGALAALAMTTFFGCAQVEFDRYDSFDDWFVARHDPFNPEDFGADLEKGSHIDYVVNDMLIRTPIYTGYDLGRILLIPVSAPYYMVKSLSGSDEDSDEEKNDQPR